MLKRSQAQMPPPPPPPPPPSDQQQHQFQYQGGFPAFPQVPYRYPGLSQDPAILDSVQYPPSFPPPFNMNIPPQLQQMPIPQHQVPNNNKKDQPPTHQSPPPPRHIPSLSQVMQEDTMKANAESELLLEKSRKISKMVKYNGLMSQWDKNFIMKIQLQQMVTEDPYNEDFYYQVHSAITQRNNPHQPLNALAQTYLYQRGQRSSGGRFRRVDPLQRMQQQVQQAVASARDHPKKDQFVAEGALGKISVGSGKRPRRALNVSKDHRPTLSSSDIKLEPAITTTTTPAVSYNPKTLLRSIEQIYSILLQVESLERSRPSPGSEDELEWENKMNVQVSALWDSLQVTAAVDSETNSHPFISMLEHDKGKKIIPRMFKYIEQKQRLTILTRIVAQIDSLDVVKQGLYVDGNDLLSKARESIELFSQTVLPPLVHLISESAYDVVVGLLEIMLSSANIVLVASTKIGLAFLTVLISRAELIKQDEEETTTDAWDSTFISLFNAVQGHLSGIFPPRNVDDSYVWHFLASLALAAKLDQQRVIVDEVRDKIFGTMAEAKSLPVELGSTKISNLNLFLNVMGLNATTTEIGELTTE